LGGLHFRRQQVIAGFIADFYWHAAKLAVEVDGNSHEGRSDYDEERDTLLNAYNVRHCESQWMKSSVIFRAC
jgi:very-short-patch-repair endonuclease